jgi:hypothetical protein
MSSNADVLGKWDDPLKFESDSGFTRYYPCDQGMKRRCDDCYSQVAIDGIHCANCSYSHKRRAS